MDSSNDFTVLDKDPHAFQIESFQSQENIDGAEAARIRRKIDLTLLPVLSLLLIVAYLDRSNIGNARIFGMEKDLGMTGSDYNIAAFLFFVPYLLLDVPFNMIMGKFRPSRYLGVMMFFWGIVTAGEGLTQSFAGLVVCRVILGTLEAAYFPGAIYLLTSYYSRYELHTRLNIYYSAALLATAFGGLIAYGIGHMDNVGGYASWRWIFIIEGIFTSCVAVFCALVLPDWPEQNKYLTTQEKAILAQKLARDAKELVEEKSAGRTLKDAACDPKVTFGALMYFGAAVTSSSSAYFLPTILAELGYTSLQAQYMSIPIWMTAWVVTVGTGFASDFVGHRWGFSMGLFTITVIGYIILIAQEGLAVGIKYMALFLVISGAFSATTIGITWLTNNIVGRRRRGISSAILLALGNCGSILGSNVYLNSERPRYITGYSTGLAMTILAQVAATGFLMYAWFENRQKDKGKRDHLRSLPQQDQDALGDKHPDYRYTY